MGAIRSTRATLPVVVMGSGVSFIPVPESISVTVPEPPELVTTSAPVSGSATRRTIVLSSAVDTAVRLPLLFASIASHSSAILSYFIGKYYKAKPYHYQAGNQS